MNDFEELARRSVEAADDSVRRLAVPDIVARRRRRRRRPVALGLALGVLLLVVGVVVWQFGDDSTPTVVGPATAGEGPAVDTADALDEQFFRLEWPISGDLEPLIAGDLGGDDRDFPAARTKVYGRGTSENPFAQADLMIVAFIEDEATIGELYGERTTVRDKAGWIDPTMLKLGFRSDVRWREAEGLVVMVSSRSMNQEELVAVAESLEFDGPEVSFDSPLDLVIDTDTLPVLALGLGSVSWILTYSPAMGGAERPVSLYAEEARPEVLQLQRYFFAPDAEVVEVRGERGWLSTSPGLSPFGLNTTERLIWSEAGVVLSLAIGDGPVAGGLSALEIADELVQIDGARWAEVVAEAAQNRGEIELMAQGEFEADDQSFSWQLLIDRSLSLCLSVDFGDPVYTSCTGSTSIADGIPATQGISSVSFSVEEQWFEVWGPIGDDVDRLVLELPDGASVDLEIYSPQSIETRVVGLLIPLRPGDGDYELVALSADGIEIERRAFAEGPVPIIPELPEGIEAALIVGSDGDIAWEVRADAGGVCIEATLLDSGFDLAGCSPGSTVTLELLDEPVIGDGLLVAGVVAACVEAVRLTHSGEYTEKAAQLTDLIDAPGKLFFAWAAIEGPGTTTLSLLDEQGGVIAAFVPLESAEVEVVC
jgi:hypothetical protein